MRPLLAALALAALGASRAAAQTPIDSSLAAYIATIRAIDSHAHPMRPVPPGAAPDTEYDALPLDGIPPFALPWRLRPENPEWAAAGRALYHIPDVDTGAAWTAALSAARARVLAREGTNFPAWALDRAGIDIMLANRIAPGPGLTPPRFRWVVYDDALMLPLDNSGEALRTPDTRTLYPRESKLLRRFLRDVHVAALPASLDAYIRTVVGPTLRRQHDGGAVAIKFEAAYLRALDFGAPDAGNARRVYARYVTGGVPSSADYRLLQDYLFHEIVRTAGQLGMAVQIHTTDEFGGFYWASGARPLLLERTLNDSTLRGTNFIIVHGGWPHVGETGSLLAKPNAYADLSMMTLFIEPAQLAAALRQWLGQWPEKVMFGSDAFDGGADQGWEQGAYIASESARRALAMALTGMMRDGEVTRARAEALARMVLRENALSAYRLR